MNKRNILITILTLLIVLIGLVIYKLVNNKDYKEITIESNNKYYETQEIELDLDNDGTKEKIKITKNKQVIEINDKKFFDEEELGHEYQYIILDIDFDKKLEIIKRNMDVMISPIYSEYSIYNYNDSLNKIATFSIFGNIPDKIYSNGKTIKFEYWPYESEIETKEEIVVDLEKDEGFTDKELEDMEYVDDKIQELMQTEKYKNLSLDDQVKEMEKLLKQLKKDKYINYYHNDDYMFSFEYKCGVLGGVMLKSFDSMLN